MSQGQAPRRPGLVPRADVEGMAWAVACCWIAVWGNYLLLQLGVTIFYIVPINMFAVPALVTAGQAALRRWS